MNPNSYLLTDKVALVTGGGTGIGKASALALAQAGAHVVVASRNTQNLAPVADEVRTMGRRSLAVVTDVTRPQDVHNVVQRTADEFGCIDILVNCAGGIDYRKPTLELTLDEWYASVDLNLTSVFLMCQAVGRVMARQKDGRIINISTSAALEGSPTVANYAAAKAGVNNLTKTLAVEWAQLGIQVTGIAVGPVDTPQFRRYLGNIGLGTMDEESIRKAANLLRRRAAPEEIATAVVFLASPAASFMTGCVIEVDGGRTAHQLTRRPGE